ncbi:type I methionyl aminopeptidase [Paenibacillus thalictri]|uniref:Methionine aminopeptidase n=1 Tax=Paenibacillus thalictri TaxID=2527873 RepID=A0A4Q9DMT2_9BACL|nr:type I methionyl aminopeptidase [Paenibacillus thalictri]TBL76642.1 type I methionyl aminopeptidase [Paenibacillus thalictri]
MIVIKSKSEIEKMREAGHILASCHKELAAFIKPGITTLDIDRFVEKFLAEHHATPEQKGYNGFPFATCTSINDVICHGFPSDYVLKDGDILTVDMVVRLGDWLADSAWSYAIGNISAKAQKLLKVTEESLYRGIAQAVVGNRIGDISHAIQSYAEAEGFSVVKEFVGHGIGQDMHEEPQVPHYGLPGKGVRLKEGMVITIEPMLNVGGWQSKLDSDGWTARTKDGSLSAQYEHTLAITSEGPLILTQLRS